MTKVRALGAAYLTSSIAGTVIAIRAHHGAAFAGIDLSTGDVGRDFVVGAGTALSAPLGLLVAFTALIALTATKHRGRILPLITIAAALFAIGQLGEPITRDTLSSPLTDPAATVVVVGNLALPILLSVVALHSHRRTRAAESVAR